MSKNCKVYLAFSLYSPDDLDPVRFHSVILDSPLAF